jgi:predicted transcriptional regulator
VPAPRRPDERLLRVADPSVLGLSRLRRGADEKIRLVHDQSRRTYGYRRITSQLVDEHDEAVGRHQVARLMRCATSSASQRPGRRGATSRLRLHTLLTVLDQLHRKGLVRRAKDGRAFRYVAGTSREEYSAELMREALGAVTDRDAVLVRFAETVSSADATVLRDALANATSHGSNERDSGRKEMP